jgi:hypothetical protein
MEPDLAKVYTTNLMPTATIKSIIPPEYHDFLNIVDPEGPL